MSRKGAPFALKQVALALVVMGHAGVWAQESSGQLQTVVVTASGVQQQIKEAPASISVISSEELAKGNYSSVADAVSTVEGVSIIGAGPSEADISIRGMPGEYTLILVDGRRQNTRETMNRGTGGVQANLLPPLAAIERIEVIRGPMSSLYGSEAMGGVINIITKKVASSWGGSVAVSATFQSDRDFGNTRGGEFWLGGPIKDEVLGLQVMGKYSDRSEGDKNFAGGTGAFAEDNRSLGVKLTARPAPNQDVEVDLGTERFTVESTPGRSDIPSSTWRRTRHLRDHYGISHTGRWDFGQSKLALYREIGKQQNWPQTAGYSDREVTNTTLEGTMSVPLGSHFLRFGGQWLYSELDGIQREAAVGGYPVNVDSVSLSSYALFLEDDFSITDKFVLTGGVRMDHHENYGSHWSPRLYGVYHVTDALTLRGGVTSGFKAPTIRQSTAGYCMTTGGNSGTRGPLCGNPDLKPETSLTQEFGLSYDWAPGSGVTATLFNTNFKNKVASYDTGQPDPLNPGGTNTVFVYDNIDKVQLRGVELGVKTPLNRTMSVSANYTYTKSKRRGGGEMSFDGSSLDGKPFEKTPEHMLNARLDWRATDKLDTFARLNYTGNAYYAGFRNSASNMRTRGSALTFDLGGNYAVTKNVSLRLSLLNLFDRKVPIDTRDRNSGLDGNWMLDEGRRLWVGLNATF
ncbi:MAG: TonB-dependent receptor [Pigmentiphaga sp.]